MGPKVWLQKFFARHGMFFSILYLGAFFVLITLKKMVDFETFPGDILLETERFGGLTLYLPFISALATAVFFTIIIEVYKGLKGP